MQGEFSFDGLFGNLVNELLPSFQEEESDSAEGHGNIGGSDALANGHLRAPTDAAKLLQGLSPLFPEVDALLSLFRDSCRELIDLRKQVEVLKCRYGIYRVKVIGICDEVLLLVSRLMGSSPI